MAADASSGAGTLQLDANRRLGQHLREDGHRIRRDALQQKTTPTVVAKALPRVGSERF